MIGKLTKERNINNQDFSQIETWSKLDFKNFFTQHFAKLEKQNAALQNIKTAKYAEIFNQTENITISQVFMIIMR
jgi:hypothetical protein